MTDIHESPTGNVPQACFSAYSGGAGGGGEIARAWERVPKSGCRKALNQSAGRKGKKRGRKRRHKTHAFGKGPLGREVFTGGKVRAQQNNEKKKSWPSPTPSTQRASDKGWRGGVGGRTAKSPKFAISNEKTRMLEKRSSPQKRKKQPRLTATRWRRSTGNQSKPPAQLKPGQSWKERRGLGGGIEETRIWAIAVEIDVMPGQCSVDKGGKKWRHLCSAGISQARKKVGIKILDRKRLLRRSKGIYYTEKTQNLLRVGRKKREI